MRVLLFWCVWVDLRSNPSPSLRGLPCPAHGPGGRMVPWWQTASCLLPMEARDPPSPLLPPGGPGRGFRGSRGAEPRHVILWLRQSVSISPGRRRWGGQVTLPRAPAGGRRVPHLLAGRPAGPLFSLPHLRGGCGTARVLSFSSCRFRASVSTSSGELSEVTARETVL